MPSLVDTNEKVRWAKKHLDALYEHVRFLASQLNPDCVSAYDDLETSEHVVKLTLPKATFDAALIAGDFVSCLRSSLDYLAWQLAKLTVDEPSGKICFPVFEEDSLKTQLRITELTYGIPDEAIVIIKSLQPYRYLSAYHICSLWKLHNLWNIVKHRHIGAVSRITAIDMPGIIPEPKAEAIDNGYIMRFPLSAKPQVSFNPMPPVTVDIEFGDRRKGPVVTIGHLAEIYQVVSTAVIPRFERFFR